MKNSGPINTVLISSAKFRWFIIIFLVGGILLTVLLALRLNSNFIIFIGVAFFSLSPWVFEKRIRKPFCKNAEVQFFEDCFTVAVSDIGIGDIEYTDVKKYNEIYSFITASGAKNDFKSLRLYLKDGGNIKYTFCSTRYGNVSHDGQGVYLPKSRVLHTDISNIFSNMQKSTTQATPMMR